MTEDRRAAIAEGLARLEQGYTYREAESAVGVSRSKLWRLRQDETLPIPEASDLIRGHAGEVAAKGILRMHDQIETVEARYVAPWTITAARLAGMLDVAEVGAASDVGELIARLAQSGSSVTLGVHVTGAAAPAAAQPTTLDVTPAGVGRNRE